MSSTPFPECSPFQSAMCCAVLERLILAHLAGESNVDVGDLVQEYGRICDAEGITRVVDRLHSVGSAGWFTRYGRVFVYATVEGRGRAVSGRWAA